MNQHSNFDYEHFVQTQLETHPFGRTTTDLASELPPEATRDELVETLHRLEKTPCIKKIGENWRWMEFN